MMLLDKLKNYKIYLVSQSPRRFELLSGMGIDFECFSAHVKENYPDGLTPVQIVEYLSQIKLSTLLLENYAPKTIFIACDTLVVIKNQIIGKPHDEADAKRILRMLSGQTHTVVSGLTVVTPQSSITDHRTTEVTFGTLGQEEIDYYVNKYKPFDKAGSYGVQEWIGYISIESIHGSFYNVMGLPTKLLWEMLVKIC